MAIQKLFAGRSTAVWIMTLLIVLVGGVYFLPRGNVTGGWVYFKNSPTLEVSPMPIPNKRNVEVTIAGAGFEAGQELGLRIVMGGVMSDVRHQVKPEPKANEFGAFVSEWKLGNELRLMPPGAYAITAVNEEGIVLATAPFVVDEPAAKSKKKK